MSVKRKKSEVAMIYVSRAKLKAAMSSMGESQSSIVSANILRSLPDDYEMFSAEDLKQVLRDTGVEWRDTKLQVRGPANAADKEKSVA